MTPQDLEAKVLAAIDALRRNERIEDDYVECKRQWPDPHKSARQLAGAANRASGGHIIWIVGVEEPTGTIHHRGTDDPAGWWAACSTRFDQTPPDLERNLVVYVGPEETVVALVFRTDRAPYVVKNQQGGSPELEVPIRDGTRTRSARRAELLRLVVPAASTPPAVILAADIRARWRAEAKPTDDRARTPEATSVDGTVVIFIEDVGDRFVMLPEHEMQAALTNANTTLPFRVSLFSRSPSGKSSPPAEPRYSVITRPEGVTATGPGGFEVHLHWSEEGDQRDLFEAEDWSLQLIFPVAGGRRRPIQITGKLRPKTSPPDRDMNFRNLRDWELDRTS